MLDEAKKLPVMNADHRPLLLYFLQESNIFIKIHAKFIRNVFSNLADEKPANRREQKTAQPPWRRQRALAHIE